MRERSDRRYQSAFLICSLAASVGCAGGIDDDGGAGDGEALTGTVALSDDFESLPAATNWADGSVHGNWTVVYTGYGSVGVEQLSTTKVLHLKPQASSSADETHSALVRSNASFGDEDLSVRMKTVAQLRTGSSPNPWEMGWVLWHYQDDQHFYYFILKPNGWELGKADPAYPGAQRFLATGASPGYAPGSYHTVRVQQVGTRITVWADGAQLTTFTDGERPYASGSIGLYTEDAHVHFDNVSVTLPSTMPTADLASAPDMAQAADLAKSADLASSPDLAQNPDLAQVAGSLPDPLYGVTVDDVSNLSAITTSLSNLAHRPTTRVVFDEFVAATNYVTPVKAIGAVSYVMGEILDSYYVKQYTTAQYLSRVDEYLSTLGDKVDLWEVGNEINGEWLGDTATVVAKVSGAYDKVKAAGKRTELTLYYNKDCWAQADHEMFTWVKANIPDRMKQGLDYVLISYYEDDCNGLQPDWNTVFNQLAQLFPNSKIGMGECGTTNTAAKASYVQRYYNMQVNAPRYVGGYFWWYFREDMVPYTQALWTTLNDAIK